MKIAPVPKQIVEKGIATAGLYSLIETAKANGLEPYKYLRYLFEHLPFAYSDDEYEKLLPSNLSPADLDVSQVAHWGLIGAYC